MDDRGIVENFQKVYSYLMVGDFHFLEMTPN